MPFRQIISKGIASAAKSNTNFRLRLLSSSSAYTSSDVIEERSSNQTIISPLIRFESARLQYPSLSRSDFDNGLNDDINEIINCQSTAIHDLNIYPNLECGSGGGGHVVLVKNGSGKTLLSQTLINSHNNNTANRQS